MRVRSFSLVSALLLVTFTACGLQAVAQSPSSLNLSPALAATSSSSSLDQGSEAAPASQVNAVLNSVKPASGSIRPFSTAGVAVTVGFLGIGGQVAVPLSERTNLRGEGNFFSYNSASYTNDGITYKGTLKLRSAEMLLDWFPFHGSFRLSPGVEIYNGLNAAANLSVPPGQSFTLNHVSYYSSQTVPVTGTALLTARKAAPMFTLGWGNIVPRHGHISVPFEVGFIYQGAPKVALTLAGNACDSPGVNCRPAATDSGIQANLAAQQKVVSDDIGQYFRFYPVVSLGFSYKF